MRRLLWPAILTVMVMTAGYLLIPQPELITHQGYSRAYFDSKDRLLRLTLADDQRYRLQVDLDDVAPDLKAATLLYEDQDYYQHPGVDPLALLRAFWSSYVIGDRLVGASTITMQVARLRWRLNTRSIPGKLVQILRALQLTRHYSKEEIFEAYLNLASYGRNIEGIEAASLVYFDKHARDLSLPEALSLCVVPQNPVKRNPTTDSGYRHLKVARDALFERWLGSSPDDADMQLFFDLPMQIRSPEKLPFNAPHFVNQLDQNLPALRYGRVDTTIDVDLQKTVEQRLKNYIERHRELGYQNGSVAVLNHRTMELEALVGSVDFWNDGIEGQVNGTTAKRSPGSTLKPFVYALAMDQGLIHPMTMLKDSPRRYAGFTPENFDQEFLGPVFARDALILSRNVPAADLQAQLDAPDLYQWLLTAGVKGLQGRGHYGLALSLGGAELTMLELLKLYATLPNGGRLQAVRTMKAAAEKGDVSVLSPEATYLTLKMLSKNPPPNRPNLIGQVGDILEVAWKTGTSFAFRDSWAIGVSGPYVIAVWIGNFDGSGNPEFVGRKAAGPLLFELFRTLNRGEVWAGTGNLKPGLMNLKKVSVCSVSGDLPNKFCPRTAETWFIPGVSPIKVSRFHRAVPINLETGLRACWHQPGKTEQKVYEFWPSDLQRIYRQAGISLQAPPGYEQDCDIDGFNVSGDSPLITSPVWGLKYSLRSDLEGEERIPFSAVVESDVKRVYWFVDDRYVGDTEAGDAFFWLPQSGQFSVRVVDDHGRVAQRLIEVGYVKDRVEDPR
ncbi:MAG: penicillin-binding protein 1C [Desulfuromonas sp.]|nr:MAG: penicillin-binding protein 1C [Desulfuromonas sp.]